MAARLSKYKILFLTTPTNDCNNHVRAFRSFAPAEHLVMNLKGIRIDGYIVQQVRDINPDVIFYISANEGPYVLKWQTLVELKTIAKTINLCSDAMDGPWHGVLDLYKKHSYFNLQVSIDGSRYKALDLAALTPVDPTYYSSNIDKDIRCGFSGSVGTSGQRAIIITSLEWFGNLTIRLRTLKKGYKDHVNFLNRCKMVLNTSWTGTGHAHHIKGRVLEAGWAGCALLESHSSPIGEWFSEDCYFTWRSAKEAAEIISDVSDKEIAGKAKRLSEEVRKRFTPKQIYGEILNYLDITL